MRIPSRGGWTHGARFAYVALAMPLGSALGLLIYSWPDVLWSEDAARAQVLAFDAMADQRLAGTIMWVGGDLLLLGALTLVGLDWFITERRRRRRTSAHYKHA